MDSFDEDEEAWDRERKNRIEKMRRSKQKQLMRRRYFKIFIPFGAGLFILAIIVCVGIRSFHGASGHNHGSRDDSLQAGRAEERAQAGETEHARENSAGPEDQGDMGSPDTQEAAKEADHRKLEAEGAEKGISKVYQAQETAQTLQLGEFLPGGQQLYSQYAVLVDLGSNSILAEKLAKTRINPASMTKILTVLVAAEHIKDLEDTFTMTLEITDYGYVHDCSSAGFEDQERIRVRDLFYGTVLPSGADAAVGLAIYVAGSQEAFVELMNEKLSEMGLSDTAHFTNCVGIYDEDHYCTVYDMAMILEAAIENEFCREVLSAHTYLTGRTMQHPEGIELSNWFLRRIEDKDSGGEVVCAKTGYVEQSGSCAASYAVDRQGNGYICVTADAPGPWRCIEDHAGIYKMYLS